MIGWKYNQVKNNMKCKNCNKEYNSTRKNSKFCSDLCRVQFNRSHSVTKLAKISVTKPVEVSVTGDSVTKDKIDKSERYILSKEGKVQIANNGLPVRIGYCHSCGKKVSDLICICSNCRGITHASLGIEECNEIWG